MSRFIQLLVLATIPAMTSLLLRKCVLWNLRVDLRRSFSGMNENTLGMAKGILEGERHALAKAITLIESSRLDHREQADLLMEHLALNDQGRKNTLRLGIAGPPGAGKSTFIEALGMRYVNNGNRVAVIPVDPSSHINGGSILGDKTRMELLSRSERAYVRASPTRGVLGGIAEHTSDVISLCESGKILYLSQ